MGARAAGTWLVAAAILFWCSFGLMPGVGVTDARTILDLVAGQRSLVSLSVVLQLLSAACYAPALTGLVAGSGLGCDVHVRCGVVLLLVGAMGSAADAVFHLFAVAMTSPGLDAAGFVPLMELVQGPGLRFILPMIGAFFVGSVWLSVALVRRRLVSGWNPGLYGVALAVGVVGGVVAPRAGLPPRAVGLAVLAVVASAQAWVGVALRGGAPSDAMEGERRGAPPARGGTGR